MATLTPKQRAEAERRRQELARIEELKRRASIAKNKTTGQIFGKAALEKEFSRSIEEGDTTISKITGRTKTKTTPKVDTPKEVASVVDTAALEAENKKKELEAAKLKETRSIEEKSILAEQEEERALAESEKTIQSKIESAAATARQRREEFSRAESAAKGVVDRTRGEVAPSQLATGQIRGLRTAKISQQRQFQELSDTLKSAQKDLEVARQSKDIDARVEAATRERQTLESLELLEEELKDGMNEDLENTLSFFDKLSPESIAGLSDEDISTLEDQFAEAGRPISALSAIREKSVALAEAREDLAKNPDNIDKQNKVLALEGKISQIKTEASTDTATEQQIAGFQRMLDKGIIDQDQFDKAVSGELGVTEPTAYEKQLQAYDLQIKATENESLKTELLKQKSELEQLGYISGDGDENILNKVNSFIPGQTPETRDKDDEFYGQCSAVVNDVLGSKLFSSSFESKLANKNKETSQIPSPGDVFISNIGNDEIGHVGFIQGVRLNEKGETIVRVGDSNRNGNQKWRDTEVSLSTLLASEDKGGEGVVGYYSPVSASRTGVNTGKISNKIQARLSRANAGESTQTVKSNKASMQSALSTGDADNINLAIDEIERKKFLPRTEKIQNDFEDGVGEYEAIKNKYSQMKVALAEGRKLNDYTFTDQALINLFNKISDPGSVVRESEFNRTGASLGLSSRIIGAALKQVNGGAGLDDKARDAAIKIAGALTLGAKDKFEIEREKATRKAESSGVPKDFLYSQLGLNADGEFDIIKEDTTADDDLAFFQGDLPEGVKDDDLSEIDSIFQ